MKTQQPQSRIESLESRITPAGNVLAQLIGGHLIITGDAAANAVEVVETQGGTLDAVAYLISPSDATTTINGGSTPVTITGVTADVRLALGAGNDLARVGTGEEMRVLRDLIIHGGDGDNVVEIGSFVVGRDIKVLNGRGDDRLEIPEGVVAEGNISISHGAGSSTSRLVGLGTGNVQLSNDRGAEVVVEIDGATINRGLSILAAGAAKARISIGADEIQDDRNTWIAGNLRIAAGSGEDELSITNVEVFGSATIAMGGGGDFLLIDDLYTKRNFTLNTGSGADIVKLDTRSGSGLATAFDGRVFVQLGSGDDVLRLGVAGSVMTALEVFGGNTWDGGGGTDRVDAANVFTYGAEPRFARFDRYGAPPLLERAAFYNFGSYDAGTYPSDLLSADLNGDGLLDLAVVDNELGTVNLLFGKPDGTFAPEVVLTAGERARGLAAGDLDGQNGLDRMVTSSVDLAVSVFLNNGAGTFGPRVTFGVGREIAPIKPVIADFDQDGHLDVATLNISDYQATSVSLLRGAGDGTLAFHGEFELIGPNIDYFGAPWDIALGDINEDGKLDLAATGLRGFGVLLGDGDGSFVVRAEKRDAAGDLELADLNEDGKLDLLIQGYPLVLQLGNGDGTFQAPVILSDLATGDPLAADFNNDGFLDVAVTRSELPGDLLEVHLGKGDGTFHPRLDFDVREDAGPIAVGDFNRDGFVDVAVADAYAARITILLNRGNR